MKANEKASVYFIGAGPGALDLLTVRGQRIIQQADLILYADSLVNEEIATLTKPRAEALGSASMALGEIVGRMVAAVREGKLVARVHSGDPAIYGAIHEQMAALRREGISYQIVPGVSSLFASAAAVGAELTVPGLSQTVIITRAEGRTPVPEAESLRSLASHHATLALFLSASMLDKAVSQLIQGGYSPDTPVAAVYRASWHDQQIVIGELSEIAEKVREKGISRQAIVLVGDALGHLLGKDEGKLSKLYDATFSHGYRKEESP
ncbi:MAG: precorrin-4 C(11)-methyltransferase [Actinobacteria bacterium]|nr:precorrin-4 C(11)-methyltransferase [Actinomycetota bacterium]